MNASLLVHILQRSQHVPHDGGDDHFIQPLTRGEGDAAQGQCVMYMFAAEGAGLCSRQKHRGSLDTGPLLHPCPACRRTSGCAYFMMCRTEPPPTKGMTIHSSWPLTKEQ
jgi:hypothetical protein